MDKKKLEAYCKLQKAIESLETEQADLKIEIAGEMEKDEIDTVQTDFGSFYFISRKTWKYPEYVDEAKAVFDAEKQKAENNGEATFKESKSLAFRGVKEK